MTVLKDEGSTRELNGLICQIAEANLGSNPGEGDAAQIEESASDWKIAHASTGTSVWQGVCHVMIRLKAWRQRHCDRMCPAKKVSYSDTSDEGMSVTTLTILAAVVIDICYWIFPKHLCCELLLHVNFLFHRESILDLQLQHSPLGLKSGWFFRDSA